MDSPLTPELALAYLRELSADALSAVVVDADGRHLVGAHELTAPARALLEVPEAADGMAIRTRAGWVFAARAGRVGVVVATGPLALAGLLRHDVAEVAFLLGGERVQSRREATSESPQAAPLSLAEAVQDALGPVATLSSGHR